MLPKWKYVKFVEIEKYLDYICVMITRFKWRLVCVLKKC
jgi:hypothetical protein